jgi:hypothetical protein
MAEREGIEYRRIVGSALWHWCRNCRQWPNKDYETRHAGLTADERCPQCQAFTEKGLCRG